MAMKFTNNATTTLASGITNSATSLTVASGTGTLFPTLTGSQYFYCTLQGAAGTPIEIVQVTARSTDTFTIVRAQDGTSASAFSTRPFWAAAPSAAAVRVAFVAAASPSPIAFFFAASPSPIFT